MSKIKGLPIRVQLREADSATGSYPTTARTGDKRTGVYPAFFNDSETVLFNTAQTVSYPTLLHTSSLFLTQELTTSIFVQGDVVKGIADKFVIPYASGQDLTPFIEDSLFEQNQTSDFYLTGSDPLETGLGFSSPLKSKTQIRLKLPVSTSSIMSPLTSSTYYYNQASGQWDRIRADRNSVPIGTGLSNGRNIFGGSRDASLFGPFGTPVVSGSDETTDFQNGATFIYGFTEEGTFVGSPSQGLIRSLAIPRAVYRQHYIGAFIADFNSVQSLDPDFAAGGGQLIEMDRIQHPFLVEKIVAKIPIAVGPGWMDDITTFEQGHAAQSVGGPVLTFALQRQADAGTRELIMSATIIPAADDFAGFYRPHKYEVSASGVEVAPQGFRSFSTPNAVLTSSTGFFTGSVTIEAKAAVSNGVFAVGFRSGSSGWIFGESFKGTNPALIASVNPFGRSMGGGSSGGRSLFGKEFISPAADLQPSHVTSPTSGSELIYYNGNQGATSPFLLLPGDKLVVTMTKFRAVHTSDALVATVSDHVRGGELTSSHDVDLISGSLDITLYGSIVRDGIEFHDTLNQPLTSDAIHEALGTGPVADQYDVEGKELLSGTYVDHIIEGKASIVAGRGTTGYGFQRRMQVGLATQHVINDPGVSKSRQDVGEVTGSLTRNIRLVSPVERYWDSLLPRLDQITKINGGDVLKHPSLDINYIQVGTQNGWGVENSTVDTRWHRSYPFESRYNVQRTPDPFREIKADKIRDNTANPLPPSQFVGRVGIMINESSDPTDSSTVFVVIDDSDQSNSLKMAKSYYGIGQGHQNSAELVNLNTGLSVTNGHLFQATDVKIRGWKYGLISGQKFQSSAVFRRDKYGNFRDMLEQRADTKFQITEIDPSGKVGFVTIGSSPISIVFSEVDPEDTFSSNVSLESTSSLPFFDSDRGDSGRNRSELPNVDVVEP